ncbi:MAG: sugar phosphate isomerase/epimerase, partial [Bacteroidetes bacterium]|nr:sugar phosphate isomerase/epimerase [Bacteroidota bacterium]
MPKPAINRREALQLIGTAATIPVIRRAEKTILPASVPNFTYCLNMSTIHGQNLGFMKEL